MRTAYLIYLKIRMIRSGHGTCYFLAVNMQERESSVCRSAVLGCSGLKKIRSDGSSQDQPMHVAGPRTPPLHVIRRFCSPTTFCLGELSHALSLSGVCILPEVHRNDPQGHHYTNCEVPAII
jgi:hypothetical protein